MADNQPLTARVAEEIRVLLTRRRMSGRKLAEALGVSQSAMSARLTGVTPIDLNDLEKIAAILNVEVMDLLPAQAPRSQEGRTVVVAGEPKRSTTVA